MTKIEKEFEFIGGIIDRHWNRAIGLANAESLMTYCNFRGETLGRMKIY